MKMYQMIYRCGSRSQIILRETKFKKKLSVRIHFIKIKMYDTTFFSDKESLLTNAESLVEISRTLYLLNNSLTSFTYTNSLTLSTAISLLMRSSMKIKKRSGPRTELWGTPLVTLLGVDKDLSTRACWVFINYFLSTFFILQFYSVFLLLVIMC